MADSSHASDWRQDDGQACIRRQGGEQSPSRVTADARSTVYGSHKPCAAQVSSRPSDNRIRRRRLQYEHRLNGSGYGGLHAYQVPMPPDFQASAFRPGSLAQQYYLWHSHPSTLQSLLSSSYSSKLRLWKMSKCRQNMHRSGFVRIHDSSSGDKGVSITACL